MFNPYKIELSKGTDIRNFYPIFLGFCNLKYAFTGPTNSDIQIKKNSPNSNLKKKNLSQR